jgi:hypothetical protein
MFELSKNCAGKTTPVGRLRLHHRVTIIAVQRLSHHSVNSNLLRYILQLVLADIFDGNVQFAPYLPVRVIRQ